MGKNIELPTQIPKGKTRKAPPEGGALFDGIPI